jgi:branched-chain amino acid transport system ATP-binding protein
MPSSMPTWADMSGEAGARALEVRGIDVHLGGVQVLHGVTFEVRPGEVFGIVGPNGAGKTTILNVIDGVVRPTAGTVRYGDMNLCRVQPHNMRAHGIGRSLQSTHYFRGLTALELVALGELPNSVAGALRFAGHRARSPRAGSTGKPSRERAADVLVQFGLDRYAHRPLSELSSAVQKLVDIARAVVAGTELLLLDEPTSGVSGHERGAIGEVLLKLGQLGRTIILIDHDPGFVTKNCDRLMAMNFGQVLRIGLPGEVMTSEVVKRSYLGESAGERHPGLEKT